MSIRIEQLTFNYGRIEALREISARALSGRITAVIGPNASGKSTLLKCIVGSIKPSAGAVFVNDVPVRSLSPRQLARHISYVPQRSIVSAAFTVQQVVELGRYALEPSPSAVQHAIEQLDLADVAERPYARLSVGQQQRVTLARALAQLGSNGHLILDEPTSAMDLQHVSLCIALLRQLASQGATVVLAMHDLSLAAAIAHDIWLLDNGRLVAAGVACDVMTVDRLHAVFRTGFQWMQQPGGTARLVADIPATHASASATILPT